jgi:hypothetical protein
LEEYCEENDLILSDFNEFSSIFDDLGIPFEDKRIIQIKMKNRGFVVNFREDSTILSVCG